MEKAERPPAGLLGTAMRWRLNRTALPPAGVTLRFKIGVPTTAPATRLLALLHVPTVSPSFRFRSAALQTSISPAAETLQRGSTTPGSSHPKSFNRKRLR